MTASSGEAIDEVLSGDVLEETKAQLEEAAAFATRIQALAHEHDLFDESEEIAIDRLNELVNDPTVSTGGGIDA